MRVDVEKKSTIGTYMYIKFQKQRPVSMKYFSSLVFVENMVLESTYD